MFTASGGASEDKKGDHSTRGLEIQQYQDQKDLGGTSQMPLSLGEDPMFTLISPSQFSTACSSHLEGLERCPVPTGPGRMVSDQGSGRATASRLAPAYCAATVLKFPSPAS